MDVLKNAHDLYYHRGRILKRLTRASAKGLARFADAIEILTDEDLDAIALECERMAIKRLEDGNNNPT